MREHGTRIDNCHSTTPTTTAITNCNSNPKICSHDSYPQIFHHTTLNPRYYNFQGLCKYIEECEGTYDYSVVVGFDARHNSARFALRTATTFLLNGARVYLFGKFCPTPFVAYAVQKFKCAAGIMVTASHNPKQDNGYKVYWSNGAQIIPPHDKGIAASIEKNLEPWDNVWDESVVNDHPRCQDPMAEVMSDYFQDMKRQSRHYSADGGLMKAQPQDPILTYSAMHGVGYEFCKKAFEAFGLKPFVPTPRQVEPDPEFPTVEYPNPEEGKGALKLAMETAESVSSRHILANDPDADRLAVAEKQTDGEWKIFTGNELGALFGWWAIDKYKATYGGSLDNTWMASSTVSSMILKSMAEKEGFSFEDTLTGFKWMGNMACKAEGEGKTVLFAFEEAIGFMFGSAVVDKDGVSASAVCGELISHLATKNLTLADQLDNIYNLYGYHCTCNSYYFCYESQVVEKIFSELRKDGKYPSSVGDVRVIGVRDLTMGYDSRQPDKKALLPVQSSQMITFYFSNDSTVTLRTSGTEVCSINNLHSFPCPV